MIGCSPRALTTVLLTSTALGSLWFHHGILLADAFIVTRPIATIQSTTTKNNKPLFVIGNYLDSLNRGGADGDPYQQNQNNHHHNDPGNNYPNEQTSQQAHDENIIVFKPVANPGIPSSSSGSYLGRLSSGVPASSSSSASYTASSSIGSTSTTAFPSSNTAHANGSYLDQLSASSTSNTAGTSKPNYAPSSSRNPTRQSAPSNDTTRYATTSSYLGALGNSSSLSPWENNNNNSKSPWSPPPSRTGPAHGPAPPNPLTNVQAYSPASSSSFASPPSSVPPAENKNDTPVKEAVIDAVVLDMLESKNTVYENLHSDIIEGEGFIVSSSSTPDASPTMDPSSSSTTYSYTPGITKVEAELIQESRRQHAAGSYEDFFPPNATQTTPSAAGPPSKQTPPQVYLDTLLETEDDEEEVPSTIPETSAAPSPPQSSYVAPTDDTTSTEFPDITPNSTWWSDPSSRNLQQQTTPVIPMPEPTDAVPPQTTQPTWWDGNSASEFLQKPIKGVSTAAAVPAVDQTSPLGRAPRGMEQPIEQVAPYDEAKPVSRKVPPSQTTTPPSTTTTTTTATEEEEPQQQLEGEPVVEEEDEATLRDKQYMQMAIDLVLENGGEYGSRSAFPNPTMAALLVAQDGTVLADGFSDYNTHAIIAVFEHAGLNIHVHDSEWIVSSPTAELTATIAGATLYLTLEPTTEARGVKTPPLTSLIIQTGIHRAVIGSPHPVLDLQATGAVALYSAGIQVSLGKIMKDECDFLIREYTELANSKLQRMARKHFELFGRPLGLLHCSVVDSDNVEAFARQGNAFGTAFSGGTLSYRNFGTYQLAPPPDIIWKDNGEYDEDDVASMISVDFEEENYQGEMTGSPLMPWYGQVDAVVVTFPREENGPPDDKSITGRLRGLKWLATHGCSLPVGVERIVVLDASDLKDLPVTNDDPNLPPGLDIEKFWAAAQWRKATRIILRRAGNASAQAAARAAAKAAQKAAEAAALAASAVEVGDAARAAEIAMEYKKAAQAAADLVQKELEASTRLKQKFEKQGVIIESIDGGEPIDIMKHLGTTDGLHSVVWRAGCWGERGVRAVLAGAFQWVSAHMAVEAMGGKFWQLMLAENAVQAAVGPRSKVKVFADQEDISLEYCDQPDADKDCVLSIAGRPVRLVRLDCRVALVDDSRPREFSIAKTRKMDRKTLTEEAPWFL